MEAIKDRNLERLIDCTGSHIQGGRDRILNLLKEDAHKLYIRH
jgi:DNA-binding GntR family transcriptional regulator